MKRCFPVVVLIALWIGACSLPPVRRPPSEISPRVRQMLADLDAINRDLHSLKGIGTLRIEDGERRQTARVAWILALPNQIRLELMSVTGAPAVSLAADGTRFSLFLHDRGQKLDRSSVDADLERFVGVPLTVAEAISVLVGRAPGGQVAGAAFQDGSLVLEDDRGRPFQKLSLEQEADGKVAGIRSVEVLDDSGRLRYRADFERIYREGPFRIPDRIRISRSDRTEVRLSVDRIWINAPVSANAFVLDMESGGTGSGHNDGG